MKKVFLIFISLLLGYSNGLAQGKLSKAKNELRKEKQSGSRSGNTDQAYETYTSYDDSFDSYIANSIAEGIFLGIAYVAGMVTYGTLIGEGAPRTMNHYPYREHSYGHYLFDSTATGASYNLHIKGSFFANDQSTSATALQLQYKFHPLISVEGSHLHFFERDVIANENLDISSLLINYHRVREKHISAWWGVGASYVANEVHHFGFAYQLGVEIFPIKPISLFTSWKQSFINHSSIDEYKLHLKYYLKNTAISTGFNYYEIGSHNMPGIHLGLELKL
ncbi:hypothetical protein HN014_19415 [Aquimarina sp. TRL1]|uniref:hypothetical protein n=1 Tax=Aquimarina sp. (strain TRL1) TaxID=2736252 RepID=UPI00158EF8C2|nr:hypothetical protein [Aquimarina sp. TRL1]QKX06992.1 hypothetical protein HN014_19415 [Aquimarina sp. TRL1]